MKDRELRVEALRAVASIIEPGVGAFGNLLTEVQLVYDWLRTGKDPVIDESDQSLQTGS